MDEMAFTNEAAAAYLSAMFDGEGCVEYVEYTTPSTGYTSMRRRARIASTSAGIVDAVKEACEQLGVKYHVSIDRRSRLNAKWQDATVIGFSGSQFPLLNELLDLRDEGKRQRLAAGAAHVRPARNRNAHGQYT